MLLYFLSPQVEDVQLLLYSPYPDMISIEKRHDPAAPWEPWQFFAHDCPSRFNMENEGPLKTQTDVNCRYITP